MNKKLEECCEFILDGTHGSPEKTASGIPVLSAQNVRDGILDFSTERFTTTEEYESFRRRLDVQQNDVLLTIVGTIGRVAVVTEAKPLVFQRSVAVMRPVRAKTDPRYLFHALQQNFVRRQLAKSTNQSSQAGVYLGKLKKIEIPLPPLEEQRRIAEVLDRADALRQKRRLAIEKLDAILQSVFLDRFGDPVTNPKNWEMRMFDQIGTLGRGKSKHRPRNAPELLGGKYPLIQTGDVANAKRYLRDFTQTYSEIGLRQSKMWKAGTLCITIAANIAKTAILTFDACFPDSVVGFTPSPDVTTEYIQYWLSFRQKDLEEGAPESAQKNINLKILAKLQVPCPPIGLQKEFSKIVSEVENIKRSFCASEALVTTLFSSMQDQAFRSSLRSTGAHV